MNRIDYKKTFDDIQTAQEQQDISALIRYANVYPEYEDYISSYLLSKQDFSSFRYSQMLGFLKESTGMPVIEDDFRYIIKLREQEIERYLSGLSIEGQGEYYSSHPDETDYIDSLYRVRVIPELESSDYVSIRSYKQAFRGTAIERDIDVFYIPFRNSLWQQVERNIDEYFVSETDAFDALRTDILVQVEDYTRESVNQIVKYLLDHKLPWMRRNVNDSADEIVNMFYDRAHVNNFLTNALQTYVNDAYVSRNLLANQLLEGAGCDTPAPVIEFSMDSIRESELKLPYGAFMRLRDAQRKIDWFSVGLSAASFTVAWPAGILLDIADLAYGIHSDKVKEAAIQEEFNSFIPAIYDNMLRRNELTIEYTFNNLSNEIQLSQQNYKDYVSKNF